MGNKSQSRVLFIDDRPREVAAIATELKCRRMAAIVLELQEVTVEDLVDADLVLVDLDLADLAQRSYFNSDLG